MSIDNIIFEDCDDSKEIARKTVLIHAGTSELAKHLKRLKIEYSKLDKGIYVQYILRGKEIGRLVVQL